MSSLEKEIQDLKDNISQLQLERTELIAKVCVIMLRMYVCSKMTG